MPEQIGITVSRLVEMMMLSRQMKLRQRYQKVDQQFLIPLILI